MNPVIHLRQTQGPPTARAKPRVNQIDTVEILRSAVAQDILTAQYAVDIADDIAAADRWLRSMHDGHIRIANFEPDF